MHSYGYESLSEYAIRMRRGQRPDEPAMLGLLLPHHLNNHTKLKAKPGLHTLRRLGEKIRIQIVCL